MLVIVSWPLVLQKGEKPTVLVGTNDDGHQLFGGRCCSGADVRGLDQTLLFKKPFGCVAYGGFVDIHTGVELDHGPVVQFG